MTAAILPGVPSALVLVDAHNFLHRYFHGMPPIYYQGRNVAAVRGLRDLIVRIQREVQPAMLFAVFDGGGAQGGRRQIMPSYKAGRPETPAELAGQIEMAYLHLPRFGAATVRVPDFEADDVIATLAGPAFARGTPVQVVSGDKDLRALVRDDAPGVVVQDRRGGEWLTIREAQVVERFGVPPRQLLDFLALAGDGSDGVPGVKGIGPKTAARLLQRHGSLAAILDRVEELAKREKHLLTEQRDAAILARRVIEPVQVPPEQILAGTLTPARCAPHAEEVA